MIQLCVLSIQFFHPFSGSSETISLWVSYSVLTLGEDMFLLDKQELWHKSSKLLVNQAAVGSLSRNIPQMLLFTLPRASSCIKTKLEKLILKPPFSPMNWRRVRNSARFSQKLTEISLSSSSPSLTLTYRHLCQAHIFVCSYPCTWKPKKRVVYHL